MNLIFFNLNLIMAAMFEFKYFESDMYRVQNGLPLEGENHSRYLPTKTPVRKNKDYKARPRNYVIGFPVYKKDHYTRNWFNLKDVFNANEAPAVKYSKILTSGCVSGFLISFGYKIIFERGINLKNHHSSMQTDYTNLNVIKDIKGFIKGNSNFALAFGLALMSYSMLKNWMM